MAEGRSCVPEAYVGDVALIVCPLCVREDDVHLVRTLPDGRKEARCEDCDFTFAYGSPVEALKPVAARKSAPRKKAAAPVRASVVPLTVARKRFPGTGDAELVDQQRAELLKQEFLATVPHDGDPVVASHWAKFRWAFSADGLDKVVISDLLLFVHDRTGGDTGDTTTFDKAWNLMGEFEGARRVRATVQHLLRGHGELEDRLNQLIEGEHATPMPGVGEALLTKTLAVAEPDRFLPVLTYDDKAEVTRAVYGLELPKVDESSLTRGRLGVWSNDLLVDLLGDGFDDLHQAASFLRWARDR
ncbi:MAG: hypothetical protein JWR27_1475 [Aeromicrobium sp.]|nr:hypothetical protein [Aeromicrobium sp.]